MLGDFLRRSLNALRPSSRGRPTEESVAGRLHDLQRFLDALHRSGRPDAYLIIQVRDAPDFLQFAAAAGVIELDLPQVTARQRALGPALRQAAAAHGLTVREAAGSDGSLFLDVELAGADPNTPHIVRQLLTNLFGVGEDTPLEFICHRCGPVA